MKNVKTTYVNLYYNLSPRFLKTYFSTGGGACAPSGPPVESPMALHDGHNTIKNGSVFLVKRVLPVSKS